MSQPVPERHLNAQCGMMLGAGGVMSYRCTLKMGHHLIPPEDPEPCWAVEVSMSAKRWQDWRTRQDARDKEIVSAMPRAIVCPQCQANEMVIYPEAEVGRCMNCGELANFQTTQPGQSEPDTIEDIEADLPQGRTLSEIIDEPLPNSPARRNEMLSRAQDTSFNSMRTKTEPTKQRPDDQRLPNKGHRIVQDWIIDAMEESKRVGSERYGQPLMTFDSRLNIKDLAEELRDAYVYVSKLQMMAEADKGTLIEVVTKALEADTHYSDTNRAREAEIAVEAILDWVLIQKVGVDQVSDQS